MSLSVRCDECGARYNVDEKLAGRRAKCKKCGATMSIPAPAEELPEDDDLAGLMSLEPPPPKPAPSAVPPKGWTPDSVIVETVAPERSRSRPTARRGGGGSGMLRRLVPLLLLAALVAGGFYIYQARPAWILARLPGGAATSETSPKVAKGPRKAATSSDEGAAVAQPSTSDAEKKRQESTQHLRQIYAAVQADFAKHEQTWPADLATLQRGGALDAQALSSPFGPAFPGPDYEYKPYLSKATPGPEVVLAHDAAELKNEQGASVLFGDGTVKWLKRDEVQAALQNSEAVRTAASKEREQQVASAAPPEQAATAGAFPGDEGTGSPGSVPTVRPRPGRGGDAAALLKSGAGGWVKDAAALPLAAASAEALVRPITPASAVAVVTRNDARGDTVEVFAGEPPLRKASASFPADPTFRGSYALSADGNFLARLVSFPRTQAVVYSFEKKADVATMDLKAAPGVQPHLVGFTAPDRLAVRWTRGTESALELWDVKGAKSLRRVPLPELQRPSPANEAVSSDGRLLAVTGRGKIRGKESLQLALYTLVGPGDPRRLPMAGLNEQFLDQAETSGVAFSPDNGRVAALFEVGGKGLVVVWNLRTSKPAGEFVVPAMPDVPTDARLQRTRGLDWVAGGRALLVCGSVLLDADHGGTVLAVLEAGKVRGQAVVGDATAVIAYGEGLQMDDVVAATLDEGKLGAGPARVAPVSGGARQQGTPPAQ